MAGRGRKGKGPAKGASAKPAASTDSGSTIADAEQMLLGREAKEEDDADHAGEGSNAEDSPRRSKRKTSSGEGKGKTSTRPDLYRYKVNRKFTPTVRQAGDGVAPDGNAPMLVFFNAKGGTLKTTHTWTVACTMSSELRGLRVGFGPRKYINLWEWRQQAGIFVEMWDRIGTSRTDL